MFNLHAGATDLGPGDLAIVQCNSDSEDKVTFVLLTDISGTTSVTLTRIGWDTTTGFWQDPTDTTYGGGVHWTYTGNLSCGTEVEVNILYGTTTIGSATGQSNTSGSGDQVLIFSGTYANPTFIWCFDWSGHGFHAQAISFQHTNVPPGLTEGVNAFAASTHYDDWQFNCTNSSVSHAALRSALMIEANYLTSNDSIFPAPGCTYNCPLVCTLADSAVVDSNETCAGLFDGGASSMPTGGTSPYTYLWSNSATTASITGVAAGTYTVTVTDINGCADTTAAIIIETSPISVSVVKDSTYICSGVIMGKAIPSNTTGSVSYLWNNGSTADTAASNFAATHMVTITDANNCTATGSVYAPAHLEFVADPGFSLTASCLGADGIGTISYMDGVSPYTFTWSTGATGTSVTAPSGTYTYTATDAIGCQVIDSVTISDGDTLDAQFAVTHMDCSNPNNGKLVPFASNGSGPYTYAWSTGSSADSLTGLPQGDYTVTITDANNCYDTVSASMWFACEQVTNLRPMNLQDTSVRLTWDTICGVSKYKVVWKVAGPGAWNVAYKTGNVGSFTLTGLTPGTTYRWAVKADCGVSGWGLTAVQQSFTTLTAPCDPPTALASPTVGMDKAKLVWTQQGNAELYRLRYRVSGTTTWTVIPKDATWAHHWLTGLAAGTTYEWQMRTVCNTGTSAGSAWTATQNFTTASSKTGQTWTAYANDLGSAIALFPNPGNGVANVAVPESLIGAEIHVVDAMGRTVFNRQQLKAATTRIELLNATSGIYFVQLYWDGSVVSTKRLVVE